MNNKMILLEGNQTDGNSRELRTMKAKVSFHESIAANADVNSDNVGNPTFVRDTDPHTLASEIKELALASTSRSEFDDAEELWRYLLHLQSGLTPPCTDDEVVATLAHIGRCCQSSGRYQEAMSCYRDALQLKAPCQLKNEPPETKLMVACILYDIGMIHSELLFQQNPSDVGDHQVKRKLLADKAIKSFQLSLDLRKSCFGEQHHVVASAQHNIAAILTRTGNHIAAKALYEKSLATRRAVLGPKPHPEVASSLRHLAMVHRMNGENQQAASLLSEALEILYHIPHNGMLQNVIIELSHLKRELAPRSASLPEADSGPDLVLGTTVT